MILKALCECYDQLRSEDIKEIPPYRLAWKAISYLIIIDKDGNFIRLNKTSEKEKQPKLFLMPEEVTGKTSAPKANYYYENGNYVLGIEYPSDKKNIVETRLQVFIERIHDLEQFNQDDGTLAIARFYDNFQKNIERIEKDKYYKEIIKKTSKNCLFAFKLKGIGQNVIGEGSDYELPPIESIGDGRCLVTGSIAPLIKISRSIKFPILHQNDGKPIKATQPKLVGYNIDAFESFGKEQGGNAHISDLADFKYTTALSYLLNSKDHFFQIGNSALIFWASNQSEIEDVFPFCINGYDTKEEAEKMLKALKSPWFGTLLAENETKFYVLQISPNNGRLAVKQCLVSTVSNVAKNLQKYFDDINIVCSKNEKEFLPLTALLKSISLEGDMMKLSPNLITDTIAAIFKGTSFPYALQMQILNRIKVNNKKGCIMVNRNRIALLKAYINRKHKNEITMALDLENKDPGYLCGRLLSVFERIQEIALWKANKKVNNTLRDQYYSSFSRTPTIVLGRLESLSTYHLQKLPAKSRIYLEKIEGKIMDMLDPNNLPAYFTPDEQSRFAIGYYQQRQAFFNEKINDSKDNI